MARLMLAEPAMVRGLFFVGAVATVGCASAPEPVGSASAAYTTQCAGNAVVEGVDISAGQAPVDWNAFVGAGRHFAFLKATQGNYYTSGSFAAQYSGAKAAGVYPSAYHFFDPTVDGVTQANYFLSVATVAPTDLPPMLDVECPDGSSTCLGFSGGSGDAPAATIVSRALDWLSTVATKTGKKPVVYSFPSYFPGLGTGDSGLAAYPLFIATLSSCAAVPAPWSTAAFWQYSWTGTVSGVPGQVDLDRFFGSLSDLQTFALSCKEPGAMCAASGDCCAGSLCNGMGVCAACLNPGDACKTDADCCGLSVCADNGTCSANPMPAQATGNRWITAVSSPATGQAQIFVRSPDGTLATSEESAGTWPAPTTLGEQVACGSAASFWWKNKAMHDGFPEVFSPGASGGPGLDDPYDVTAKSWSPTSFGGPGLVDYVSLPWPDGHVEVFAHDAAGAVWHRWWSFAQNGWVAWTAMGGSFVSTPTAIIRGDGQAELFAVDAAGQPWHDESGPFTGGWSGWRLMATQMGDAGAGVLLASRPVPVRWADGHVDVFATTPAGTLVTASRSTVWSAFTEVASGVQGEPSAVISSAQPEVFVRDAQGNVAHTWPTTTGWQPLTPLFAQASSVDPWAWEWLDGTVEVFAATGGQLSHVRRSPTGTWATWQVIGPVDVCEGSPTGEAGPPATPSSGGCSTNPAPPAPGSLWLLVGLAALRRRYATSALRR